MENVKIQFKGITRNTDDGICPDGECMELINARVKSSGIEPIGNPILLKQTENKYTSIYHHTIAKRYIGVTESGQMYEMPEDFSTETILTTDVKAKGIEFIGNTVSIVTEEGLRYMIFRNGNYIYLGELPDVPDMTVTKSVSIASAEISEISETDTETRYGNFLKVLSEANKNGKYCYSAAFCAAFRLFDGSYTKSTPIQIVYLTNDDTSTFSYIESGTSERKEITLTGGYGGTFFAQVDSIPNKALLICFKPTFSFEEYDLSAWNDIIVGIEIFSSDNFRNMLKSVGTNSASTYEKDTKSPYERASDISLMYNIASLTIGQTSVSPDIDVSSDNLATLTAMIDSFGTHHKLYPERIYSYNNRMHIYQVSRSLFEGFRVSAGPELYKFKIYTYIHSSEGDKVVLKEEQGTYIPAFVMYPDSRAYKMIINCVSPQKGLLLELKSSEYFNYSYRCNEQKDDDRTGTETGTGYFKDISIDDFNEVQYLAVSTDNLDYSRENIMFVSNVNNPFFFPEDQTYQFNTPIVGIQSNVIAMSQGQFGQFPLYVFTRDGVYAMSVGSGTVAYSTQTPVTRDVCNNPDSICGLDTMVAFSTYRGLMVIDGASTQLISEKIYGFLPSCNISSPVIMNILNVASLGDMASSSVFPDYLEGAKVGYNYEEKEIVVANSNFPYSYVYSLKTGEWHKISQQIENFVNSYPYTWAMTGNQILDLNNTHRSVSKIAVVTRPIKMGTLSHKRILQTALRGIARMSSSDLYIRGESVLRGESEDMFSGVGMYILASNDAEHFVLVGKKEMMKDIRDLVTRMNKTKPYKYFMVCLVGGVRTDVWIDYIEFVYSESFNNRLR